MSNSAHLQAGGTLPADAIYIVRDEDTTLFDLLRRGAYVNLLSARQMGKSSLTIRVLRQLESEGVRTCFVDLASSLGTPATANAYFLGLIDEIAYKFDISIDIDGWLHKQQSATNNQKLRRFIIDKLIKTIHAPILVAFDEIDSTLKLPYTDDLFLCIRGLYNDRALIHGLERLSFLLIGVATPDELIKDRRTTPFNIGETMALRYFDHGRDDLSPLLTTLNVDRQRAEELLACILNWTGGQPYLTIRLCQEASSLQASLTSEIDRYVSENFSSLNPARAIAQRIHEDTHVQSILRFVNLRFSDAPTSLKLYQRVLAGEAVLDQQTLTHIELKLSGLVRSDASGHLHVANNIYRRVFDSSWMQTLQNFQKPQRELQKARSQYMRMTRWGGLMLAIALVVAGIFAWRAHEESQLAEAVIARVVVEVMGLSGQVQRGMDDGTLTTKAADALLQTADSLLANVSEQTPSNPKLLEEQSKLFLLFARYYQTVGNLGRAKDTAVRASNAATVLEARPENGVAGTRLRSLAFAELGNIFEAEGDLDNAVKALRERLRTLQRLAAADPGNASWQRDLSVSLQRIGDARYAEGKLDDALAAYQEGLAIAQRLAASDPSNASWQRDLMSTLWRISQLRLAQGNRADALKAFEQAMPIAKILSEKGLISSEDYHLIESEYSKIMRAAKGVE